MRIDEYVWIGLSGLVKGIDRLGGVNVEVTNPGMDDFYPTDLNGGSDPYGYYRVAVLPGAMHLGGAFQLWTVSPATAGSLREITTDLGLDSTSAPVWLGT